MCRLAVDAIDQREFPVQGFEGHWVQCEMALQELPCARCFAFGYQARLTSCTHKLCTAMTASTSLLPRSEMRTAGIQRLELTVFETKRGGVACGLGGLQSAHSQVETIAEFAALFPDQSDWLALFAELFNTDYVCQLRACLEYDGPPELLTMHLCLLLVPPPRQCQHAAHYTWPAK